MKRLGPAVAYLLFFPMFAARAQSPATVLPSAPAPILDLSVQATGTSASSATGSTSLTRRQAEQLALKHNPRVSVSQLLALAQHQVVREARSAELPTATGAITAEKALNASRISAGSLTASRLFTHAGAGGNFSQLITDFGRTHNLVLTQKFQEQAANADSLATKEEIVLATDQAFYDALTAQAVLQVAKQTVAARNATQTQVNQMTQNKLKSTLDLSFADVNLSQSSCCSWMRKIMPTRPWRLWIRFSVWITRPLTYLSMTRHRSRRHRLTSTRLFRLRWRNGPTWRHSALQNSRRRSSPARSGINACLP